MDEEWDTGNFKEPIAVSANKWEGEDEEDEVKDSWDAEDEEEKKDVEKVEPKPKQKPKKALVEKIAEKERQREEEIQRKLKEREDEISMEERLRKQQESDLQMALETTFGFEEKGNGIDGMHPTTKEEFAQFAEALNKKLLLYSKSPEFPNFVEDHIRNVCVALTSNDLKKLKTTIDNLYLEKQKAEKGDKGKKGKGKSKAKLKVEGENTIIDYEDFEYDDFM